MRPSVVLPPASLKPPGSRSRTGTADAEQSLVGQDVLPAEEAEFPADEQLAPGAAHREEHLAHVDRGAEAVVHSDAAPDRGREPEVDAEVRLAFLALGIEDGEGGQEADGDAGEIGHAGPERQERGRRVY